MTATAKKIGGEASKIKGIGTQIVPKFNFLRDWEKKEKS
jgi:hypothetical protein